jgi:hypothetical protein
VHVLFQGGGIAPDVAERIAADINHLLFSVWKMKVENFLWCGLPMLVFFFSVIFTELNFS